jgi:hypothetical protein
MASPGVRLATRLEEDGVRLATRLEEDGVSLATRLEEDPPARKPLAKVFPSKPPSKARGRRCLPSIVTTC